VELTDRKFEVGGEDDDPDGGDDGDE